jgi:hypothetical protein
MSPLRASLVSTLPATEGPTPRSAQAATAAVVMSIFAIFLLGNRQVALRVGRDVIVVDKARLKAS